MGLIRVSDEVEGRLKEFADGRSMSNAISSLLDGTNNSDNTTSVSLNELKEYIGKRFDEITSILDDTRVDRLDSSYSNRSKRNSYIGSKTNLVVIDWPLMQEIMFDFLEVGAEEWLPGREGAARGSSDMDYGSYFSDGEIIFSDDMWGKTEWLKVSPRISEFLSTHIPSNQSNQTQEDL